MTMKNPEKIYEREDQEKSTEKAEVKQYITREELLSLLDVYAARIDASISCKSMGVVGRERSEWAYKDVRRKEKDVDIDRLEKSYKLEKPQYFPKKPQMSEEMWKKYLDTLPKNDWDRPSLQETDQNRKVKEAYREACNKSCVEHHRVFNRQSPEAQRDWIEREILMGADTSSGPFLADMLKLYNSISPKEQQEIFTLLAHDRTVSEYPPSMDPHRLNDEFKDYVGVSKKMKKAGGLENIEKMPLAKFVWSVWFTEGENENTSDDKLSEEAKDHGIREKESILEMARKIQDVREEEELSRKIKIPGKTDEKAELNEARQVLGKSFEKEK